MQALSEFIKEIKNDPNISTLNEAQTRRSVIERILKFLGWDIDNYNEVKLEYAVETRRVDYALQISGKNEVFIEAKKPQQDLENHQEQLLDYSFREGVKLAILTNGILWWFYLPTRSGVWRDRKFYTLHLEQESDEIAGQFDLLLSRENVGSGKAVQHAESILQEGQRAKTLKENLPKAWNSIIKESDSLLVDLLAEKAEEFCGFKPKDDEILQFMHSHRDKWLLSSELAQDVSQPTKRPDTTIPRQTENQTKKPKRMQIGNESYELEYGYEIFVNTANWLIDKGVLNLDRPFKSPRGRMKLIGDTIQNEYPSGWKKLKNDFYIFKNINTIRAIDLSKKLLEHYEYDPKMLHIGWE